MQSTAAAAVAAHEKAVQHQVFPQRRSNSNCGSSSEVKWVFGPHNTYTVDRHRQCRDRIVDCCVVETFSAAVDFELVRGHRHQCKSMHSCILCLSMHPTQLHTLYRALYTDRIDESVNGNECQNYNNNNNKKNNCLQQAHVTIINGLGRDMHVMWSHQQLVYIIRKWKCIIAGWARARHSECDKTNERMENILPGVVMKRNQRRWCSSDRRGAINWLHIGDFVSLERLLCAWL